MACQMIFERYEMKYLLSKKEKERVLCAMKPYMKLDQYGRTTIRNVYFDTDHFRLIRHSLEKPIYKEKLRIRSYQSVHSNDPVFVELKKKFKAVVYKRRLLLAQDQVMSSFSNGTPLPIESQIAREIDYFRFYYKNLHPTVFLSYEREAYSPLTDEDFRVTFDENILYRQHDLSLQNEAYGTSLLEENQTLMEIKTTGGIPLWMCHILTQEKLFKTSFSKYGAAYQNMLAAGNKGDDCYVSRAF